MSFPKYEHYKDSGVEWLGEVPAHWNTPFFQRCVYVAEGQVNPEDEPYRSMILVAPNHVESGTGRLLLTETAAEQSAESGKYLCQPGDVIYSKIRPALRKACLSPDVCLCSADMYPLRGTNGLRNEFLFWFLLSDEFSAWAVLESDRVAMPKINRESLKAVRLVLPTEAEQMGIAQFLNAETTKLDALITEQRTLIDLLKEKRQAVISHAVTKGLDPRVPMKDSGVEWLGEVPAHWDMKRVKDCGCEVVDCKNRTPEPFDDGDYFVVRTSCVKDGQFNPEPGYRTDEANFIEWTAKGRPQTGDVLFTREAPTGEACLAPEGLDFCLGQRMMYIRPPERVLLSEFLLYSIYGGLARERISEKSKGSTVGHLRVGEVGELPLLLPPLDEQHAITKFVGEELSKLQTLAAASERAIVLMKERRSALISAAVTGKIDVRGRALTEEIPKTT